MRENTRQNIVKYGKPIIMKLTINNNCKNCSIISLIGSTKIGWTNCKKCDYYITEENNKVICGFYSKILTKSW